MKIIFFIFFFTFPSYAQTDDIDIYKVCQLLNEKLFSNSKVIFLKDIRENIPDVVLNNKLYKNEIDYYLKGYKNIVIQGLPSMSDSIIMATLLFYQKYDKILDSIFQNEVSMYMVKHNISTNDEMIMNYFDKWGIIYDSIKFSHYPFSVQTKLVKISGIGLNDKQHIIVNLTEASVTDFYMNRVKRIVVLKKKRNKMKIIGVWY